ncbi:MAG TPA: SufE family protein [Verrucomicrobiae bacterium]|nr:SufE family protein [Verrucomicrobiae bacterium]
MSAEPYIPIAEKQRQLERALADLKSPQDRLAWMTQRGRAAEALPAAQRTDAHRLEGCLARTWLAAEFDEGRCRFRADSESAIIKGIAVTLCEFFSGQTPEEVASVDPRFLERFGVNQHLTPNRRNSLSRMFEEIRRFAAQQRP